MDSVRIGDGWRLTFGIPDQPDDATKNGGFNHGAGTRLILFVGDFLASSIEPVQ